MTDPICWLFGHKWRAESGVRQSYGFCRWLYQEDLCERCGKREDRLNRPNLHKIPPWKVVSKCSGCSAPFYDWMMAAMVWCAYCGKPFMEQAWLRVVTKTTVPGREYMAMQEAGR